MLNSLSKAMGSCRISSQLKNFSFLIGNETGWDGICQFHFHPAYVIGMKKYLTPVSKFEKLSSLEVGEGK